MNFKEISIKDVSLSPSELFGDKWALIGSGDREKHNIMTASWGLLGKLWNKDVAVVFIRPSRYSFGIVDNSEYFTINFFSERQREALNICGTVSGRDCDKFERTGLSPYYVQGTTAVEQAELIIVCKKIAISDMSPDSFLDDKISRFYATPDYHRVFAGEIVKVLER